MVVNATGGADNLGRYCLSFVLTPKTNSGGNLIPLKVTGQAMNNSGYDDMYEFEGTNDSISRDIGIINWSDTLIDAEVTGIPAGLDDALNLLCFIFEDDTSDGKYTVINILPGDDFDTEAFIIQPTTGDELVVACRYRGMYNETATCYVQLYNNFDDTTTKMEVRLNIRWSDS